MNILSLFLACSSPTLVDGQVNDIWGNPVEGVTASMQGADNKEKTDGNGEFSFTAKEGKMSFRADKSGYIPVLASTSYKKEDEASPKINMVMYPDPESKGFWAIGSSKYIQLQSQKIHEKEANLNTIKGLHQVGKKEEIRLKSPKPNFVFRTDLRKEQVTQLGLQIHRLEFVENRDFQSLTGIKTVAVNLWIATDEVKYTMKRMETEDRYLVQVTEPLKKGIYCFHSNNVLTNKDSTDSRNIPEELLLAYPFEIH
ncbi:MAG: hypothetical protein VX278_11185 [Myxococcota bacterium]|nr:hypothetical protein [Myxococcota bacterium]